MGEILKTYLLDFWIWWYWFKAKRVLRDAYDDWAMTLGYLNIIPMLTNLFQPLFQDKTFEGRLVAIPIRCGWVFIGSIILLLYSALLIIGVVGYFLIPLVPVFILFNSAWHWL